MFTARVADRKRGWAKCCGKSCAAKLREKQTGAYSAYLQGNRSRQRDEGIDDNWCHPFSEDAFRA